METVSASFVSKRTKILQDSARSKSLDETRRFIANYNSDGARARLDGL